jgi:putative spermidine/putrescine transport system permease protein
MRSSQQATVIEPRGPAIYIWPAILLLGVVFFVPLAIFFWKSLSELGSLANIFDQVVSVVTARGFVAAMLFTVNVAILVCISCLILAYPIAYMLTNSSGLVFNLLIATVIVPYFVSAIVRTYAWMVLLGRTGVINQILLGIGAIQTPAQLLYNQAAVVLGMTYVLLPYMVLTLYASMKAIDKRLLQAAEGMGATAFYIFRRVFFPLSLSGVISGSLIVFIMSLGFFLTPALMGGNRNVTIAMMIEQEVEMNFNWPIAAVMSLILLAVTLSFYLIYFRVSQIKHMIGDQR